MPRSIVSDTVNKVAGSHGSAFSSYNSTGRRMKRDRMTLELLAYLRQGMDSFL